jgi:hypothetical protein
MAIKFVLLVNKQGQTRLAKYTDQSMSVEERRALEGEVVRKCLARSEKQVHFHIHLPSQVCGPGYGALATGHQLFSKAIGWGHKKANTLGLLTGLIKLQCSFIEHRLYKIIYRRYASLFFLVGVDSEEVRSSPPLRKSLTKVVFGSFVGIGNVGKSRSMLIRVKFPNKAGPKLLS